MVISLARARSKCDCAKFSHRIVVSSFLWHSLATPTDDHSWIKPATPSSISITGINHTRYWPGVDSSPVALQRALPYDPGGPDTLNSGIPDAWHIMSKPFTSG